MKKEIKFKIIYLMLAIIFILISDFKNNSTNNAECSAINKQSVVVSQETLEKVHDTIIRIEDGEDVSTADINYTKMNALNESNLESDANKEQEGVSYDGDNTGKGESLLGSYQGITYYSQADSRWSNNMYSILKDRNQTIKSSGCGPTSMAIIISSSKGTILPSTLAELFVDNGYRTENNGTAWNAFPFAADYFGFKEYYTTSSYDKALDYLSQKDRNGNSKYFAICSCASGLFTYNGHYITLMGVNEDSIQVYDPYMYQRKI